MIERIVIRGFLDGNGIYYKVRKKFYKDTDYGIFLNESAAQQQLKRLQAQEKNQNRTTKK